MAEGMTWLKRPMWGHGPLPAGQKGAGGGSFDYGTMTTEDIKALRIPAAKDCVLFLWVTVAMWPQGHAVMSAWGFAYKSAYFWFKPGPGHGYWSQQDQVEVLLVGTRGNVPAPAPGTQPRN